MIVKDYWHTVSERHRNTFILLLLFVGSALPAICTWFGADFSSSTSTLQSGDLAASQLSTEEQFRALAGAFHHLLLEWTAVSVAMLGSLLALLHYRLFRDTTAIIFGFALFCAGVLDAFHSLAASHLVQAKTDNADFIPFTWALSRCLNGMIIIVGIITCSLLVKQNSDKSPSFDLNTFKTKQLSIIGLFFIGLTLLSILVTLASKQLPQTTFPQALITRPFDVLPLALFVFAAAIVMSFSQQHHSFFTLALLANLIPQIAAQLHMSFGSTQLYDSHFNIAHGLKVVANFGMTTMFLMHMLCKKTPNADSNTSQLAGYVNPEKRYQYEQAEMLEVGYPTRPQALLIPGVMFLLALTLTAAIGSIYYFDSSQLVKEQEIKKLRAETNLVEPTIQSLYSNTSSDVLFLSQTPPIQGIISALSRQDQRDFGLWKDRLTQIFSQRLANQDVYTKIRYIGLPDNGKEIVNVRRTNNLIQVVPDSRLQQMGDRNYVQDVQHLLPDQVYYSKIEYNREFGRVSIPYQPVLRVATPVFDKLSGELFGLIIINVDFEIFLDKIVELGGNEFQIFIASDSGDFLLHPDKSRVFGFEFGNRFLMQEEFAGLENITDNKQTELVLESLHDVDTSTELAEQLTNHIGFYRSVRLDQYGSEHILRLLLAVDNSLLYASLSNYRNRSILLGLALAIMALALAFIFSRRIIAPLTQTTLALEHLERTGDLKPLPVEAKDEIGVLARRFNNLIVQQRMHSQAIQEERFAIDQHAIVATTDVKGTITYVNKKFCEISGYAEAELIGANHRLLKSGAHDQDFFRNMYLTISRGEVWHNQICNRNKAGHLYWVDTTIVPFLDDNGKPRSYIALRTDITAQKQTESDLIRAKESAEQAAKVKSEFLASMSHEIRTPMNGVLGMLNLLSKSNLSSEQTRRLKLAQTSAQSLLTLINDILDFSKVEAGKLDLEEIEFDLVKLLGDFAEAMALRAQEKKLELVLDITHVDRHFVKGDPGRLRQILTNLVGNALKFTEQGEIVIRAGLSDCGENGQIFTCKVQDTGIGIPEDKVNQLFQSFTQLDTSTTRKYGGTGLGLSIVKQLCELMQGSIAVVSEVGKGSSFEFNVCLDKSDNQQLTVPSVDISKLHLLVVDDNATNREVLTAQFRLWGATVAEAADGLDALALVTNLVRDNKPLFDVAFLDMQMPGMDGAELGRRLQDDDHFKDIKLVMMTSMSQRGDAKWFANLGFSAYFPKPATFTDLYDALAVVVDGGKSLDQASPLVTHYYLQTLRNGETVDNDLTQTPLWPPSTRILLVEDNQINQEVAVGQFEAIGLTADIAGNGQEAIIALLDAPLDAAYSIVFMDCQMPVMDGFEATRQIRAGKAGFANRNIPIIAMTANAMKGDRETCLAAGMVDYISKPVEESGLVRILRRYLLCVNSDSNGDDDASNNSREALSTAEEPRVAHTLLVDEVWDHQQALKRVGGKENRLHTLVTMFLTNMPERIERLNRAIEKRDMVTVADTAHEIKGVLGNIGANAAMTIAGDLEHASRNNQQDDLVAILPGFFQYYSSLCAQLDRWIGDNDIPH